MDCCTYICCFETDCSYFEIYGQSGDGGPAHNIQFDYKYFKFHFETAKMVMRSKSEREKALIKEYLNIDNNSSISTTL